MRRRLPALLTSFLTAASAPTPAARAEDATAPTVVEVTRFGAEPDDDGDDTAAVIKAIEACPPAGPSVLAFPKGRYRFRITEDGKQAPFLFRIAGKRRLTIDGRGSEFLCEGLTGVFSITDCRELTVRDLAIDWKRPPFTVGRVVAVEGKRFDLAVDDEFPVRGKEDVDAYMDYDAQTKLPMRGGLDEYGTVESVELVARQTLRLHLKGPARVKPGSLVVLRHQCYNGNAFGLVKCSDVVLRDVTVYTCPGMGVFCGRCENVTLERYRDVIRPGTKRLMSSTVDAAHFGMCRGLIRMDGCELEGMGDDAVNVNAGLYLIVQEKPDDRTVLAGHPQGRLRPPDAGDALEFSRPKTLVPFATARAAAVDTVDGKPLCRIRFAAPLPADVAAGDLIGDTSRAPKVRISNCTVRRNRARGFLIQSRDVVIENCRFEACTSAGVLVYTDAGGFYEPIGTRDVTIRNSTFEGCNYGAAMTHGAITVSAVLAGIPLPPVPGIHRGITIEGNTVRGTENAGIWMAGTDGAAIRGNAIEAACRNPRSDRERAGIYIMSSRDVTIEGNTVEPKKQAAGCETAFKLDPTADAATVRCRNNTGF